MFIFFHIEIPIEEIWGWCGTGRAERLNRLHRLNPPRIRRFRSALSSIKKLGKDLHSIKLLVENRAIDKYEFRYLTDVMIGNIIEGCPKLKTLTLEPLEHSRDLSIKRNCLEKLLKSGKELETLRVIKGRFPDLLDEKEVKEILPTWNVEMEECKFTVIPILTVYD